MNPRWWHNILTGPASGRDNEDEGADGEGRGTREFADQNRCDPAAVRGLPGEGDRAERILIGRYKSYLIFLSTFHGLSKYTKHS
jgi:hypothetical protein